MATQAPTKTDSLVALDAFVGLLRAHSAVTRELSSQLSADHGLSLNAYEALLLLAREEGPGLRRVDLADRLLLTASGITRLLDGLEAAGLVGREECSADRRVTYAVLTPAGRDKVREASKSHTRQIRELLGSSFSDDELRQLASLLDRMPGVGPGPDGDACAVEAA